MVVTSVSSTDKNLGQFCKKKLISWKIRLEFDKKSTNVDYIIRIMFCSPSEQKASIPQLFPTYLER